MLYDQDAVVDHIRIAIDDDGGLADRPRRRGADPDRSSAWMIGGIACPDGDGGLIESGSMDFGDEPMRADASGDGAPRLAMVGGSLRRLLSPGRRTPPGGRDIPHRILDALPDAVLVCDARGHIHFRNRAAERMIVEDGALIRDVGGCLHTPPREQPAFLRALARAIERKVSLTVTIEGLAPGRHVIRIYPDGGDTATALVTVRNIPRFVSRQGETAAQAYGFTPAETALAINLLKGLTVEQHAAERDLRVSTVRSQLSALFAKTATQRQGQLISLLLTDTPHLDAAGEASA